MAAERGGAGPVCGGELCAGLTAKQTDAIDATGTAIEVEAGKRIFVLCQEAAHLYLIERGRLALSLPLAVRGETRDVTVQECEPGALVGWSALVAPHRYTLSAHAVDAARLVRYAKADLERVFAADPHLAARVMANLAGVIGERLTQLQAMLVRDLQRRISESG